MQQVPRWLSGRATFDRVRIRGDHFTTADDSDPLAWTHQEVAVLFY